jgi:hypothetical protein
MADIIRGSARTCRPPPQCDKNKRPVVSPAVRPEPANRGNIAHPHRVLIPVDIRR